MENISIKIDNLESSSRNREPVSVGIPIPEGEIRDINSFGLKDGNGEIPAQFTPLSTWGDTSLKWVLLIFRLQLQRGQRTNIP